MDFLIIIMTISGYQTLLQLCKTQHFTRKNGVLRFLKQPMRYIYANLKSLIY